MPVLNLRWVNESIDRGPDPLFRAPIRQLTSSKLISWGIYCEQIYASTDGRRVAFMRMDEQRPGSQEIWVADLESFEIARVGPAAQTLIASTPLMDSVYYLRPEGEGGKVLVRLNLRTLELDDVFASDDCPWGGTPAVSTDERWFASNKRLHDNVYGLYRVDLKASRWEFFHEEKDICNTHLQFEPSEGRDLLVQQNRGCILAEDGRPGRLCGDQGPALYVVGIDGKNQRFLPLGPPRTGKVDGHQCWISRTKRVLAAVEDDLVTGGQCIVAPGDAAARRIMPGFCFIHVCASADGRFIVGDHGWHRYVYMGSLQTGRVVQLCECPCSRSGGHHTWEEPYIVPGNRHIIFNSERTGHAELYAAGVPEHVTAYLNEGT
ncbi:MAG: hypothetical protein ACE15C_02110 [Phycisphaerae bacterium]